MSGKPVPLEPRFYSRVSPEPNTGCWLWTGAVNDSGYGVIAVGGRQRRATFAALVLHGRTPEAGVYVLHRCDQPACVNPDHLFTGTQLDNMKDCVSKGRMPSGPGLPRARGDRHWTRTQPEKVRALVKRGEACPTAKLTASQVTEIRRRRVSGEQMKPIARAYGVSRALIGQIVNRRIWREIP